MCGTVKVADFGLSEDMYSTNYFRQGKSSVDAVETKVPIRWMPLESIEEGLYNEKSDVVRMERYWFCHRKRKLKHKFFTVWLRHTYIA